MGALTGQHAIITGGGSGIGLACAEVFLSQGAQVTLVGRTESRLIAAVDQLEQRARYQVVDIGDEDSIARAIQQAHEHAPLTIAIANAGTGSAGPFLDTDSTEWHRVMQTNLSGTFYTFKHAGRAIAASGGGAMCAVSSIAGLRSHKLMSAYCTSKAAVDMLVRNTADELGNMGIRVNSVCPGLVETELSQGLQDNSAMLNDYLGCMPIARTGMPNDVAQAISFLCGPDASWITGVSLPVDGGHHLRRGPNLEVMAG